MDLRISDVADLFGVSEATIQRWVQGNTIPFYRLSDEYRFNREEIESWMLSTLKNDQSDSLKLSFGMGEEDSIHPGVWQRYGLYRAIHKGDVLTDVEASTKQELIEKVMGEVGCKLSIDAEGVATMLLDREKLMSTGLNNGVAIPHTRDFLLSGLFDAVIAVYPKQPIDWGSLDEKPVHTLFFLFACDDKRHLNLLAKVAHISSEKASLDFLKSKPNKHELLTYLKEWEGAIGRVPLPA